MPKENVVNRKLDRRRIRVAARRGQEQRRFQRVPLSLPGRYLDPVRGEFKCELVDVSPGGARIRTDVPPAVGEEIIMLFEGLGRITGEVLRAGQAGFAVSFLAGERKRDRLADAITWNYNKSRMGLEDDRGSTRKPSRGRTTIHLKDGVCIQAEVIDVSLSGAAFACQERPRIGETVWVGDLNGKVARHIPQGVAVSFAPPSERQQASA